MYTCGGLRCPSNTVKCIVYETSLHSNGTVEKTIQCRNVDGKILDDRNSSRPFDASQQRRVNNYAELSLTDGALNCSDCDGDTPEEIVVNMHAKFAESQRKMGEDMENLRRRMDEMREDLSHMNDWMFT